MTKARVLTLTRQGDSIYYSGPFIDEPQWGGESVIAALKAAEARGLYNPMHDTVNDLSARDPHNIVAISDEYVPPTHTERVAKARAYHDVVFINTKVAGVSLRLSIAYEWELAGPNGARFILLAEKPHTKEELDRAKREIQRNRDVVGRIRVLHASGREEG